MFGRPRIKIIPGGKIFKMHILEKVKSRIAVT